MLCVQYLIESVTYQLFPSFEVDIGIAGRNGLSASCYMPLVGAFEINQINKILAYHIPVVSFFLLIFCVTHITVIHVISTQKSLCILHMNKGQSLCSFSDKGRKRSTCIISLNMLKIYHDAELATLVDSC